TADVSCAPRGRRQWLAFFHARQGECESRNQHDTFDRQLWEFVMKKEHIWRFVGGDRPVHRYVSAINHSVPELVRTAFELITRCAGRAAEVNGLRSCGKRIYFWRVAGGAI